MSLFGSYLQEANVPKADEWDLNNTVFEGVEADVDANINESMTVLAFLSGQIVAETANFEELTGLQESMIPQIFTEASNAKFEAIKAKVKAFVEKVLQFFADISMKIQANVLSAAAKLNKKGTFKKSVKIYDVLKDKEYQEDIDKIVKAINALSRDESTDVEIDVDKYKDEHFAKYSLTIAEGSKVADAVGILDHGKAVIKNNKLTMAECKKLKSKYEKAAASAEKNISKDDVTSDSLDAAKAAASAKKAVGVMTAAMEITKIVSTKMFKNAIIIGNAALSGKGEKASDSEAKKISDTSTASKEKAAQDNAAK